jgi:DeoR/GlpR family transcriptional regulator of sugar metabolism
VTALTNCLMVAEALAASPQCRVMLTPGDFVLHESGVYGADTVLYIGRFRAKRAVIGASGVAESGVMDADSASCAVKRAMMACAERTTLLVDSTKFGAAQFERVCTLADIDEVVCEAAPPKPLSAALRRAARQDDCGASVLVVIAVVVVVLVLVLVVLVETLVVIGLADGNRVVVGTAGSHSGGILSTWPG